MRNPKTGQRLKADLDSLLQGLYKERNSAFYITHTFRSLEELYNVEHDLRQPIKFLDHFIAIEISNLPEDVSFLTVSVQVVKT